MDARGPRRWASEVWRSRVVVVMVLLPSAILVAAVAIWVLVFPPFSGM